MNEIEQLNILDKSRLSFLFSFDPLALVLSGSSSYFSSDDTCLKRRNGELFPTSMAYFDPSTSSDRFSVASARIGARSGSTENKLDKLCEIFEWIEWWTSKWTGKLKRRDYHLSWNYFSAIWERLAQMHRAIQILWKCFQKMELHWMRSIAMLAYTSGFFICPLLLLTN